MKKGKQKKKVRNMPAKIIYVSALAAAAALVSYRGGAVSYLFFYFMIMLPLLAFVYTVYVYLRFKIVQDVSRIVVRAQEVPYRLLLANEDPIAFTDIKLNFFTDMVSMSEASADTISLLPHEKLRVDTKMCCKYRGTYPVGVKSVTVTDFLRLFTITYPLKSQIRLTAKPRIIALEDLKIVLKEKDPKNAIYSVSSISDIPDFELRQYQCGDPIKLIHWKNSARAGELLVRKNMPDELFETALFMDLTPVEGDMEKKLSSEDCIIETAISFVHDYYLKKIPIRIVYMATTIYEVIVDPGTGFEQFYNICTDIAFRATSPIEKVWLSWLASLPVNCSSILVTGKVTESLERCVADRRSMGCEVLLVKTGEQAL